MLLVGSAIGAFLLGERVALPSPLALLSADPSGNAGAELPPVLDARGSATPTRTRIYLLFHAAFAGD